MTNGANPSTPRGVFVEGEGFVRSETVHPALLTNNFAVSGSAGMYRIASGNVSACVDLGVDPALHGGRPDVYGMRNACGSYPDVLAANALVPGARCAAWYRDAGFPDFCASVYAPSNAVHPYVTLLDGWDIDDLMDRFCGNDAGRRSYLWSVYNKNIFGGICPISAAPTIDVPQGTTPSMNFLGLRNNPVRSGLAEVRFGLARKDRVEIKIHDLAGRAVRTLASREFPAGEHTLNWDGRDDEGRVLPRGIYFTQARYGGGFVEARKLVILK
jgi:hypothetical protein